MFSKIRKSRHHLFMCAARSKHLTIEGGVTCTLARLIMCEFTCNHNFTWHYVCFKRLTGSPVGPIHELALGMLVFDGNAR